MQSLCPIISTAGPLPDSAGLAKNETKRLILEIVGSNVGLKDGILNIEAVKPFRAWQEASNFSNLRAYVEDVRTLLTRQDPAILDLVANIRQLSEQSEKLQQAA